jgi:hypothetical protein
MVLLLGNVLMISAVLGLEKNMKSEDRNDSGSRERYRQEPRKSQEGSITAYDPAEAPDLEGESEGKEDGGGELGHGHMLSGPLEHRIVKN